MSGSDENSIGPDNSTNTSPNRVHGANAFASSLALWRSIPKPSSRKSTRAMVPTAIANPRMCMHSRIGNDSGDSFSGFSKAISIVQWRPSRKLAQLQGSVGLRAELPVFHQLEERLLLRRSDESGPARRIFPKRDHLAAEALTRRGCLERGIGLASILGTFALERRFEKHGQNCSAPDIQICDRNRTI